MQSVETKGRVLQKVVESAQGVGRIEVGALRLAGFGSSNGVNRGALLGRINRREIPRRRRPATSQERSKKKTPVCSARNDCWLAAAIMGYFTA